MKKPKRTLAELNELIPKYDKFLKRLRQERREEIKAQHRAMPKQAPGRKPIDPDIIALAKKLGQRKPLTEVALQLDVALRTLYTHGVSRKALNAEKAAKEDANCLK